MCFTQQKVESLVNDLVLTQRALASGEKVALYGAVLPMRLSSGEQTKNSRTRPAVSFLRRYGRLPWQRIFGT